MEYLVHQFGVTVRSPGYAPLITDARTILHTFGRHPIMIKPRQPDPNP